MFVGLYFVGFAIVYITNNPIFGVFSFLFVYVAQEIVKPYIVSLVNKNTESKHRATAISTVSLFSEFPYMITVIFFGSLIKVDNIRYLYLVFVAALCSYVVIKKTGKRKRPTTNNVKG